MTVTSDRGFRLDGLLDHGLSDLDISAAEHALAVTRYTDLGGCFDDHWSATRGDNLVMPQGSFLLGTVVRNIDRNEGIDIDLVAIRDVSKFSTTQTELKEDAGVAVSNYRDSPNSDAPEASECSRCFTLTWHGMHLDVLPAIPNSESPGGILITDRDVVRWLPSNPKGYAGWFRAQMVEQLEHQRVILAKEMEIEEVPEWQVKTTLQRAVQALKRHRDIYFADRDGKPASVVVTTLAAMAYQGGDNVYEVLRSVTGRMGDFLVKANGRWTLPNPAQPGEDFMDSWAADPGRAEMFFEWLETAQQTFDQFGLRHGLDHSVPLLGEAFGDRFAKAASQGLASAMYGARQNRSLRATSGGLIVGAATVGSHRVKEHSFRGGSTD